MCSDIKNENAGDSTQPVVIFWIVLIFSIFTKAIYSSTQFYIKLDNKCHRLYCRRRSLSTACFDISICPQISLHNYSKCLCDQARRSKELSHGYKSFLKPSSVEHSVFHRLPYYHVKIGLEKSPETSPTLVTSRLGFLTFQVNNTPP